MMPGVLGVAGIAEKDVGLRGPSSCARHRNHPAPLSSGDLERVPEDDRELLAAAESLSFLSSIEPYVGRPSDVLDHDILLLEIYSMDNLDPSAQPLHPIVRSAVELSGFCLSQIGSGKDQETGR